MATMFAMWPENVLRLAAIDCSSPMSAKTDLNTGICDAVRGGDRAGPPAPSSGSSPAVFSATVLPPVLGPVITSTRTGGISETSTGTGSASGAAVARDRQGHPPGVDVPAERR